MQDIYCDKFSLREGRTYFARLLRDLFSIMYDCQDMLFESFTFEIE